MKRRLAWLIEHMGAVLFNHLVTFIPSHTIRQGFLKAWGATIGKDTSIFRGTTVLGIQGLTVGEATTIGFRCLLDSRGGLTIGDNVVIASDVHFIAGHHLPNSDDFSYIIEPTLVEDYAWIASRSTVLEGLTVGRGAVVAACSLVRKPVEAMSIVAGIPAKPVGVRQSRLTYRPMFKPMLF